MSTRVGLYGTGLFNETNPSPSYAEQITQLTKGGFTTVLLWSIHVQANGDFYYNDTPMVSGGKLQLGSDFADNVNALVSGGVSEILLSVGAWGTASDFVNLQATWDTAGAKNLQALCAAFPVTAVDFDYEPQAQYDPTGKLIKPAYTPAEAAMIIDLTMKVSSLGVGVTYSPYENIPFWTYCLQQLYQLNGNVQPVQWLNLQCYAGGAGNDPLDWITAVNLADAGIADSGAFVVPGYWVTGGEGTTCPSDLQSTFQGLSGSGITGGFLWNSGDLFQYESANSPSCGGATYPVDYANAIVNGLGGQSPSASPSASTSNTFAVSIPAGPIESNDDAQTKAPIVAAAHGGTWNGQWSTAVSSVMSTVGVEFPAPASGSGGVSFTMDVPAGPIWSNDDAQTKGPVVAASYNGTWNGQWAPIVAGKMSVIGVTFNW
ncbi:mannan-binding lectin [Longimicrobium sp.]|uniref:mannan-binding lectin n=1 Tax=Longimicrobium sp. TaxID=2029185 RepID=UPI003B3B3DDF